jgi:hypothetical protein
MWKEIYTIVAAADLSAQQYKFISALGVLATSATQAFGILQGKSQLGEHAPVVKFGHSRLYVCLACSLGDMIGASDATSGAGTPVGSGGVAFAQVLVGANSGGIAQVTCFGAPAYLTK